MTGHFYLEFKSNTRQGIQLLPGRAARIPVFLIQDIIIIRNLFYAKCNICVVQILQLVSFSATSPSSCYSYLSVLKPKPLPRTVK